MQLLLEHKFIPPPVDYLYVRIGCRRRRLIAEEGGVSSRLSPRQLRKEYRWVYLHLEPPLFRQLLPVFEFGELRVLVLALRYLSAGEWQPLEELLQPSLLQQRLRRELQNHRQAAGTLAVLERLLRDDYPIFRGITQCYLRQGPGGVEQRLIGGYLPRAIAASGSPKVRELLIYLLDMRNLLAVYKHLHWQLPQPPPLLSGGRIPQVVCLRCWQDRDPAALQQQVRRRAGLGGNPEQLDVEAQLEQGLKKHLQQLAREPLQIGVLLDYLWCCREAARTPAPLTGNQEIAEANE